MKKYNYYDVNPSKEVNYELAFYACLYFIIRSFGMLDFFDGMLGFIVDMSLIIYIWWTFQQYFVQVGDTKTAKWFYVATGALVFHFGVNFIFKLAIATGFLTSSAFVANCFAFLQGLTVLGLLFFMLSCLKLMFVSHHHSFGLKRIALASFLLVPLYFVFSILSNITILGDIAEVLGNSTGMPDMSDDLVAPTLADQMMKGPTAGELFGPILSGVGGFISMVWTFMYLVPYFFLLLFFNKVKKISTGVV